MTMRDPADAAYALSPSGRECLGCIAGHMIPANGGLGVPGADDPTIVADMVGSLGRDGAALEETLRAVDKAASGRLAALSKAEQGRLLGRLRSANPAMFGVVEAVVSRAYYRDDRVLASLDMEARSPFPRGYEVENGGWSLLDPVRSRGAFYRET